MIGPGSIVTICKQQTGNHGNLRITNGKCDNNSGSKDNKNDMLHTPVLLPPPLCGANSFCTKAGTCSSTVKLHVLACEHTHCCRPLYTHLTTQEQYTQLASTLLLYLLHSPAASKSCHSEAQLLLGVQPCPDSPLILLHSTLLVYNHCRPFWRMA